MSQYTCDGPSYSFLRGVGWERFTWYNPLFDQRVSDTKMTAAMVEAVTDGKYDDGTPEQGGTLHTPDKWHPYNLVSSLCMDGWHRAAIDLDDGIPDADLLAPFGNLVMVASSTSGHWHLYGDAPLQFGRYVAHLTALSELDFVQDAYLFASQERGQTLLRPPHVRKPLGTTTAIEVIEVLTATVTAEQPIRSALDAF